MRRLAPTPPQAEGPLRACPALRSLSLARCRAGPASGSHLAAAFSSSRSSLERLDLQGNSLGNDGAEALAGALSAAAPGTPLSLDLTSNEISSPAAAAALGGARRLRALELFDNPLGDEGAAALAAALGADCADPPLARSRSRPVALRARSSRLRLFTAPPSPLTLSVPLSSPSAVAPVAPAAKLVMLNLGATSLGIAGVRALFSAVRAGSAPDLDTLEVSANDSALSDEGWDAELAAVRDARPGLDVAWKAADSGVGGAEAGPPPAGVQAAMEAARAPKAG